MDTRPWHAFYDHGVPHEVDFEELTLPEFFARSAREHADATALVYMNRRMLYAELHEHVLRFASALENLGVNAGDRVAIQLPNLPQTAIAVQAALLLGARVVMSNPLYTPRELEHQWNDAGCRFAVVADFLYAQKLRAMRNQVPVEQYVVTSIPEYLRTPLRQLAPLKLRRMDPPRIARVSPEPGVHRFQDLMRAAPATPRESRAELDDPAFLQYTGGTTGFSKGAILTHRSLSCCLQQLNAAFVGLEPGREVVLGALPWFHIFGLAGTLLWPSTTGGATVVQPDPRDVDAMLRNLTRHRVSIFPAVPMMFQAIAQHPRAERADLSSVKGCFSGSAPLNDETLERFERLTGGVIMEGFGMTETSLLSHCNPLQGTRKVGTIGIPAPSTDARIVDLDAGTRALGVGEEGELVLRGPQIMAGYWNRPEETAETLRDGWLHTGDIARMDDDGYFTIVGRKKDMILAGGYNVYPDEIDTVLMEHPDVRESCTIGIPDERRGETVKSFLILEPGSSPSMEDLALWCRERLAAYKVPRQIEIRDELPRSTMLKLLRRVLRDEELAKTAPPAASGGDHSLHARHAEVE